MVSFILITTFSFTAIAPSKRFTLMSIATSLFSILSKMPKTTQFFIFIDFGGMSQISPKIFPYWCQQTDVPRRRFWACCLNAFLYRFFYNIRCWSVKMYRKLYFILLALQLKYWILTMWNSLKEYVLKMLFEENFLRLKVTVSFQKS